MSEFIKTGIIPGAGPFREVEPVSPYPRIDPHQPKREEYPRRDQEQESLPEDRARRRYNLMRELIENLRETFRISRVDHFTAEIEMHNQGLALAEELLISQLLQLKIPLASIDHLFQQIRQQGDSVILAPGRKFAAGSFSLFPQNLEGLTEYCLEFSNLQVRTDRSQTRIQEEISQQGRFTSESGQLRLTFRKLGSEGGAGVDNDRLRLDIQILVGVMEADEAGRRAILYPLSNSHCGLYADKLINMSI